MNILYVLQRYPGFGGIETVTQLLTEELCERLGHRITVFATSRQDVSSQMIDRANWSYIYSERKGEALEKEFLSIVADRSINVIVYQDSYIPEEFLLEHIDHNKTKVIVCEHNAPDSLIIGYRQAYQEVELKSPKKIIQKAVRYFRYLSVKRTANKHHHKMLELADRYFLLSDRFKITLQEQFNISSPKVFGVGNPVNMPICNPEFLSKKKEILFVGRLSRQKGIFYLMDIWSLVERKLPAWKLVIVGDGDQKEYIENYIKDNNLKNVNLTGFKNNVLDYYRDASILMMTSIYEGFPMVLYEAMAQGCVPIAFNTFASITDIIDNCINGIIVAPYDILAYAQKTIQIASDRKLRRMMMANGVVKVKGNTVAKIADKWNNIFNEITLS